MRAGDVNKINKCNGRLTKILEKCQRRKINQLEKKTLPRRRFFPCLLSKVKNNKCRYQAVGVTAKSSWPVSRKSTHFVDR